MKIACNYFPETEQLFDEGAIELDYFKFPALTFQMEIMKNLDEFEAFCAGTTARRPILLHGLYPAPHDLSSPSFQSEFDDTASDRLIKMTKTPGISLHPSLTRFSTNDSFDDILNTIISNASFLKDKYSHLEFVSLENLDHLTWGDLIKPEIITKLINDSGCGFLLDVSHAYYASRYLKIPFYDYLMRLPLGKITEIHINGWIETETAIMSHTKIHEKSYQTLRMLLQLCEPKIITIEYGRHNDRIGSGCPVITPNAINLDAKNEILEQLTMINSLIN